MIFNWFQDTNDEIDDDENLKNNSYGCTVYNVEDTERWILDRWL